MRIQNAIQYRAQPERMKIDSRSVRGCEIFMITRGMMEPNVTADIDNLSTVGTRISMLLKLQEGDNFCVRITAKTVSFGLVVFVLFEISSKRYSNDQGRNRFRGRSSSLLQPRSLLLQPRSYLSSTFIERALLFLEQALLFLNKLYFSP